MAQTTIVSVLKVANGNRLFVQTGRNAFAAGTKTSTLTIGFTKVRSGHCAMGTNGLSNLTAALGMPVITDAMITQKLTRLIYVQRKTSAGANANSYDYEVFGS